VLYIVLAGLAALLMVDGCVKAAVVNSWLIGPGQQWV